MEFQDIYEGLIEVKNYDIKGKLPDPFLMDNGSRVKSESDWLKRREEIYKTAIELQFGTQPPEPEFLDVELLYDGGFGGKRTYLITTGTYENPISFQMQLFLPKKYGTYPVVVDGDMCFRYSNDKEYISAFCDNNIILALFNRVELAHDIARETEKKGRIYKTYPEYTFGSIGAWAWGYSRCVDALEKIKCADMSCIAFSGHSRGGKTAMLAGALDQRAAIVNPNETCAGACSCYRLNITAVTEDGEEKVSESLEALLNNFKCWLGEGMKDYVGKEDELPFDSHFLKAMVAPRVLFVSEAASDIWANPVGSWMTTKAAGEVYKFLGCEEKLLWYFRRGYHFHKPEDVLQLANVINHFKNGEPLNDRYFKTPFKQPELIYDWRCPEKE